MIRPFTSSLLIVRITSHSIFSKPKNVTSAICWKLHTRLFFGRLNPNSKNAIILIFSPNTFALLANSGYDPISFEYF